MSTPDQAMKKRNDPNFFLHDPSQTVFDVPSVQQFTDNVINPCLPSTYNFLTTVLKYLKWQHDKFKGFHKIIHMGGDEVPHRSYDGKAKSVFANSPQCRLLIDQNKKVANATWQLLRPTSMDDLQPYFTKRFLKIIIEHGFSPAAWEEPWTFGTDCLKNGGTRKKTDCVRPKTDFVDNDATDLYAFNWNVDFEFK